MQDRVCLRRNRTINPAGRALALHCLTISLMGDFPPRKSLSPPVLFSGIEPSTHRPMDPSTQQHPSGSPVTSVLSTLPVVITILLLLIFRPRDAISSTTPTLLRDWHSEMCRASTVRGQWECWSQESNIGYTSIYLGASSLSRVHFHHQPL